MSGESANGDAGRYGELSARITAAEARIAANEATIAALQDLAEHAKDRASHGEDRADADRDRIGELEVLADQATLRSERSEARAEADRDRIGILEVRANVDAALIAELQADGLVSRQHAANLEAALRSSRTIGAAMGIVMAKHRLSEEEAFQMLRKVSMDGNRKLREVADDVVLTGEVTPLTPTGG